MKPMNRLLVAVSFLLLNVTHGLTQQPFPSTYEVQMIPPNPNIAQLGKFGDIPVNKYNGTANISVPIYEIDHDGLKIPIALRYNTSGVRVEQEASWVGLGWSLSEGMTITREINGFDDLYESSHLSANSDGWIYSKEYMTPTTAGALTEAELVELQNRLRNGNDAIDTEPDFFSVSLPSGSCKFTLPKIQNDETTLVGVVSDSKNFKVQYNRVDYTFKVTDPNGFVYDFTVLERSTGYGSFGQIFDSSTKQGIVQAIRDPTFSGRLMITSWRVSVITSPLGRVLEFTYDDGFYFSFPHFSESHDILATNQPEFLSSVNQVVHTDPQPRTFAHMTAFHTKNLSLISGDFGSVDFVLSDRSDLVSKEDKIALSGLSPGSGWNTYLLGYTDDLIAKKVDQIIIKNKRNEVVKTANLSYTYFNSQKVGIEPAYDADDPFECDISYIRLKLDQVDIGDQRYKFEYYQPNALPRKDARSVDFWGFHNGKSNSTKVPSFNRFYVNHPGFSGNLDDEWHEFFVKVTGGNRSADINFGKIGILEKVIYPTGGYTIFDYEGHKTTLSNVTYHPTQYLSNGSGKLRFTNLTSSTDYNYSYQYLKLANTPTYSLYDYNTCNVSSTIYSANTSFEITQTSFCNTQNYNIRVDASISCAVGCSQATPSGRAVWIRNVNTGQEYHVLSYNGQTNTAIETTMSLPVGTYQLKTANWTQNSPTVVFTASAYVRLYSVDTPPAITDEEFEVGGARIKSITNYDADGSFFSKKNYLYDQYVTDNGPPVSNGKLMDELIFHSKAYNLFDYSMMDFEQNANGAGAILSSDSKIRTNPSASGSHIGYTLVREERVDAQGNRLGQVATKFNNKPNEYILKPTEYLPRITLGAININDFHTEISDLSAMGIDYYQLDYEGVYILGARPVTHDYSNGSIVRERIYDQSNVVVSETGYEYNTVEVQTYSGTTGAASVYPVIYFLGNSIIHFQPYLKIHRVNYKLNLAQQVSMVTSIEHSGGGQISQITTHFYENPQHGFVTRTSTTNSDGSVLTTKYYYPEDLPSLPFMNDLVSENQLTTPVIVEIYKGTTADPFATRLEKVQTFYSSTTSSNGKILPREVITYRNGDVTGQKRVVYEKYSYYGALTQYRQNDEGTPMALLWEHYKLLPIAQVSNAEVDQVAFTSFDEPTVNSGGWVLTSGTMTSATSKTGTKCLNTGSSIQKTELPNGDYIVGFWARVVSGSSGTVTINGTPISVTDTEWKYYTVTKSGTSVSLSSSNVYVDELRLYPVGAQMMSYTYKPLVGMTSQTDPNGRVTYFEYDSSGRLLFVKDDDGNILKSYQYHYFTN